MKLSFEVKLDPAEEAALAGILKKKPAELNAAFAPYAATAVQEYVSMFLGQKVFTRGSDIREYRLFLLIRTAFENSIPDEQTVCALYQCTLSQSRALLRAVMSKYQVFVEPRLRAAYSAVNASFLGVIVVLALLFAHTLTTCVGLARHLRKLNPTRGNY